MSDIFASILLILGIAFIIYSFISVANDNKRRASHRKQVESYWDSMANALQRIADKLES